jgi:hypothetical protein
MMDAKAWSLLVTALVVVMVFWQRNRILDLSCTGVFFVSYLVFDLVGILVTPWLTDEYILTYHSGIDLGLLSENGVAKAIAVVAGGMGLALAGNMVVDLLQVNTGGRAKPRWGFLLRRPEEYRPLRNQNRLRLLSIASLALATWLLWTRQGLDIGRLISTYSGDAGFGFYTSRAKVSNMGFIYSILVFNVLPFLSVISWMVYRYRRNTWNALWAWALAVSTSFLLLNTFQKRPLVFFLLCLLFAHFLSELYLGRLNLKIPRVFPISPGYWLTNVPWVKVILVIGIPFAVLVWFYYTTTNYAAYPDSAWQGLISVIVVSVDRVFSRLSVMALMYVDFFPRIDPHYGLDNVGKFTSLLGRDHYADTVAVYKYYTHGAVGSGAIGAIPDFYGAFGWWGLAVCSFVLGASLNLLDRWLKSMAPTVLNRAFFIFMLVFAFYLSQANVTRSLSTYGGGTFWLLWFVMSLTLARRRMQQTTPDPNTL